MTEMANGFVRANVRFRQRAYERWHRRQLKQQILRSQIGFSERSVARPAACMGCHHYHGQAYGLQKDRRTRLICAFHPYGWQAATACPDWQSEAVEGSALLCSGPKGSTSVVWSEP